VKVIRPNFTGARLDGDKVRVDGKSDENVVPLIVDIRVVLVQQGSKADGSAQITPGPVDKVTSVWHAELPSEGFVAGRAVAFGTETRSENFTTVTWAQELNIE